MKNIFIFLPAFFGFKLHSQVVIMNASIAFLSFSLVASAVYILNDWNDRHEDRKHPVKCKRPIASGRVSSKKTAISFIIFLFVGAFLANFLSLTVFGLILLYFVLNIGYSLKLKQFAIIDVTIVSIGFVIRLFVGAKATNVELSHWIIVMTFLLALFLSLAKRRDDVILLSKTNQNVRKSLNNYNLVFLDSSMVMTAAIVILAYILWAISPEVTSRYSNQYIFLTSIFVILGILRYMQLTFVNEKTGSPTKVLIEDLFLKTTLTGWMVSFIIIFYI